jgi:hypothetical protein
MKKFLTLLLVAAKMRLARGEAHYEQELSDFRDGAFRSDSGAALMVIERIRRQCERDRARIRKIESQISKARK